MKERESCFFLRDRMPDSSMEVGACGTGLIGQGTTTFNNYDTPL